jgi:sugar lactone lactonase YvrE
MHPERAASFTHSASAPLAALPGWPVLPPDVVLDRVVGVAVDSGGRIYFAHRGDRPLWRLHPDGRADREIGADVMRKTTAYDLRGPTPKPIATKCWMHGLHVDAGDNVWVTDVGRHLVMKFSPEGRLLLVLGVDGQAGCGPAVFNQPTHVCVVPSGEVYITDGYGNSRVVRLDAQGRYLGEWGSRGTDAGQFHTPHTIVQGPDGRLYVSDRENDRVQVFDLDGRVLAVWEGLHSLDGLCFGPDGELYASCGIDNAIVRLDSIGRAPESWARPGDLLYPHALAFDAEGMLLAAETGDRCRIVSRRAEEHFVAEPRPGPEGSRLSRWRLPARA